jgi:hypothetical protein
MESEQKTDLITIFTPSDKYHEGVKCVEIREKILKDRRNEALERDRPTHYSSKIGYFNANWTNHHRLLVDDVKNHYLSYSSHIQYSITLQTRLITKRDKFRSEQQLIS